MQQKQRTSFEGDVLRLVTGTSLAQVITFAAAPVITRLYTPESFGIAATFAAAVGLIASSVCLRYEQAIVLPESNHSAANLLLLSLLVTSITTSFATFAILSNEYSQWITDEVIIYPYRWLLPIAILMTGLNISLRFWSTRHKRFSHISTASVTEAITSAAGKIISGMSGHATGAILIQTNLLATFIFSIILGISILRKDGRDIIRNASWSTMRGLIVKYRKFPIFGTWAILLGNGTWLLPTILFGIYFSPEFAGLYAIGVAVLQIPTSLLGSAVGQVFFRTAAEAHRNNHLQDTLTNLFNQLVALCVLPYMILTIVGADLFELAFGSEWRPAGIYVQILAPWALLWFISSPFSTLFSVLEKQGLQLMFNLANFSVRLLSMVIAIQMNNPTLAVILLSATGIIAYGYKIVLTYQIANIKASRAAITILKHSLLSLPPTLAVLIVMLFNTHPVYSIGLALLITCVHAALFNFRHLVKENMT